MFSSLEIFLEQYTNRKETMAHHRVTLMDILGSIVEPTNGCLPRGAILHHFHPECITIKIGEDYHKGSSGFYAPWDNLLNTHVIHPSLELLEMTPVDREGHQMRVRWRLEGYHKSLLSSPMSVEGESYFILYCHRLVFVNLMWTDEHFMPHHARHHSRLPRLSF